MGREPTKTRYVSPPSPVPSENFDDEPGWWLFLSPEWHAHVQNLVGLLENRKLWAGTDEEIDFAIEQVQAIMEGSEQAVRKCCINDLTFDPATGVLSYVDGNGNTVVVLNEGDIDFDWNPYSLPSLPAVSEKDIYCYAAQQLAKEAADDLRDFVEAMDLIEDITEGAVSGLFKSLLGAIPVFGELGVQAVEYASDVSEGLQDWFLLNVQDADAISKAAEILYCAFQVALEDGAQPTNAELRQAIISKAGTSFLEFSVEYITDLLVITDVLDVMELPFNALDEVLIGYTIVAYLLLEDASLDLVGAESPITAWLAKAARDATYFDSRDCNEYGCLECQNFDFTSGQNGWVANVHPYDSASLATYESGVGWTDADALVSATRMIRTCQIRYDLGGTKTLRELSMDVTDATGIQGGQIMYLGYAATLGGAYVDLKNGTPVEGNYAWAGTATVREVIIGVGVWNDPSPPFNLSGSAAIGSARLCVEPE